MPARPQWAGSSAIPGIAGLKVVEARLFGEWSMYFGRLDQVGPDLADTFGGGLPLDPFAMEQRFLLALMCAGAAWPVPAATTLRLDRLLHADTAGTGRVLLN